MIDVIVNSKNNFLFINNYGNVDLRVKTCLFRQSRTKHLGQSKKIERNRKELEKFNI